VHPEWWTAEHPMAYWDQVEGTPEETDFLVYLESEQQGCSSKPVNDDELFETGVMADAEVGGGSFFPPYEPDSGQMQPESSPHKPTNRVVGLLERERPQLPESYSPIIAKLLHLSKVRGALGVKPGNLRIDGNPSNWQEPGRN